MNFSLKNNCTQRVISYNNPIQNELTINSKTEVSTIELYNLEGKLIKKSNSNKMETSIVKNGIYMAKILFENGETKTIKVIKK